MVCQQEGPGALAGAQRSQGFDSGSDRIVRSRDGAGKAFNNMRERLAAYGYRLHRTRTSDGPVIFFVVRRNLARQFATLAKVEALAALIEGARHG